MWRAKLLSITAVALFLSALLVGNADANQPKGISHGHVRTPTPTATPTRVALLPTATPTSPMPTATKVDPTPTAAPVEPTPTVPQPTATPVAPTSVSSSAIVYDDALGPSWVNWSWDGTVDLASTAYVQSGARAVAFTATHAWGAFSPALGSGRTLDTSPYTHIRFYVNGGQVGGQIYHLTLHYPGAADNWGPEIRLDGYINGGGIAAGQWRLVEIPLSVLGAANTAIDRLALQEATGGPQPTVYFDAIQFVNKVNSSSFSSPPPPMPSPTPTAVPSTPIPSPSSAGSDLFARTDLIYGSEIGGWTAYWLGRGYDGQPVIADEAAKQLSRDAKITVYRWLPWTRFSDMGGDMPRTAFDNVINGIRNVGAEPFIKLPPGWDGHFTKDGNAANDVDIVWLKEIIRQAGPRVRLYEFTNEPNYYGGWTAQQYVEQWNTVVPQLKAYARSLGFDIYIGGPSWAWEDPDAFNVIIPGIKAEYDRTGNADLIPAFWSYHTYASSEYESLDWILWHINEFGKYFDQIRQTSRQVWGFDIPLADTEWNFSVKADDRRDLDQAFMDTYTHAMLDMFRQHGIWLANQFTFASGDANLDMIDANTFQPKPMYWAFKEYSAVNR